MFGLDHLFHRLLFGIIGTVANIVDVIIDFLRMILGLSPLEGTDNASDFLSQNLTSELVLQTFLLICAAGVVFVILFTVVRLIKAQMDERDEHGTGKAIRGALGAVALMLVVPLFAVIIVTGASFTAQAIDGSTRSSTDVSYSTEVVFSTVDQSMLTEEGQRWYHGDRNTYTLYDGYGNQIKGMTAVKLLYGGWTNGVSAEDKYYADAACTQPLEWKFSGWSDFDKLTTLVNEGTYFDSFILPMLGGFVMLCSLAMSGITIAQRLFSVVFLLIISPIPICARPIDDGARYKKWSEMFLGKVIGSYGIIFALNVFFSISPMIVSHTFFVNSFANGVAKLLIYIAGVVFATGANVLIGQLIGADAGQAERDQAAQNMRSTGMGVMGTMMAIRGAKSIALGSKKLANGAAGTAANFSALGGSAPMDAGSVSSVIGGSLGRSGFALANGTSGGVSGAAQRAGRRVLNMPIVRTAAGAAIFAGGAAAGAFYRTFGKNTKRGKAYAYNRADQKARRMLNRYKSLPVGQREMLRRNPRWRAKAEQALADRRIAKQAFRAALDAPKTS